MCRNGRRTDMPVHQTGVGQLDLPMDYRLTGKQGTWYAYDVIVDGSASS